MTNDTTSDRIVAAALELFARQGVKKTDLGAVAHQPGVTRVTVYRYFGDKKGLVRAACLRIAGAFERAAEDGPPASVQDLDERLPPLGNELSALPQGNWLVRLEEISRLYPAVYAEFRRCEKPPWTVCCSSRWRLPGGTACCVTISIRTFCGRSSGRR